MYAEHNFVWDFFPSSFFILLCDHNDWVDYFVIMVCARYVCVAIIHRTLTWTSGSLTCTEMLTPAIAHGGCTDTESWLWEENPLPHWGIKPASATWWSAALPTELHPHPLFHLLPFLFHADDNALLGGRIRLCVGLQFSFYIHEKNESEEVTRFKCKCWVWE